MLCDMFIRIYPAFEIEYCLQADTRLGRNESDWSISSDWFTGKKPDIRLLHNSNFFRAD